MLNVAALQVVLELSAGQLSAVVCDDLRRESLPRPDRGDDADDGVSRHSRRQADLHPLAVVVRHGDSEAGVGWRAGDRSHDVQSHFGPGFVRKRDRLEWRLPRSLGEDLVAHLAVVARVDRCSDVSVNSWPPGQAAQELFGSHDAVVSSVSGGDVVWPQGAGDDYPVWAAEHDRVAPNLKLVAHREVGLHFRTARLG